MTIKPKNSIKTPSYFCKRLKDNGFFVFKIFNAYGVQDSRRWTVLIDPGVCSIYVTCYMNKEFQGDIMFEFNDGGQRFPKNFSLKTDSIETVISHLLKKGVNNDAKLSPFYTTTKYLSSTDEREEKQQQEE
jgi:hypothetical protein